MAGQKIVASGGISNGRTAIEPFDGVSEPISEEVADYIADMLRELRDLAKAGGLPVLGTMLDLAEREANRGPGKIAPSDRLGGK